MEVQVRISLIFFLNNLKYPNNVLSFIEILY